MGGPMDPLVERDIDETLLTDWLGVIEADVAELVRREERGSESSLAGKTRLELLEEDAVRVMGRDEESLAFR